MSHRSTGGLVVDSMKEVWWEEAMEAMGEVREVVKEVVGCRPSQLVANSTADTVSRQGLQLQLDWTPSRCTQAFKFPTNRKGYDKSKITYKKLSASSLVSRSQVLLRCLGSLVNYFLVF